MNTTGGFAVARKVANSLTDGQQSKPAVAQTADGRIIITWGDEYTTGTGRSCAPSGSIAASSRPLVWESYVDGFHDV
ncbi:MULTISPECIES: hypothetical protein [Streptomyces]|uniref:hypothetical protein n=1 Tax=Streptomyces TaxID=1883 RepID=UPI0013185681|nr:MULTISPECIES: hypothetical protein [Streptomyces]QGZ51449.1 hypothetical protein GPZ77_26445 [Streptomyces sp. QHH-9511]GGU06947.1 hypothetical protein GCM10010272_60280 [Streptomyces lateritius]